LGDLGVDGYNIKVGLKEINMIWWYGLDLFGSWWGPVADHCEHCNEPLGSIKDGEFLD
jgi:hypothetical protein